MTFDLITTTETTLATGVEDFRAACRQAEAHAKATGEAVTIRQNGRIAAVTLPPYDVEAEARKMEEFLARFR